MIAGLVLGATVLFPFLRHFQLRFALEHYIAGLKAQGQPTEFIQIEPSPPPPELNGVPFIQQSLTNVAKRGLFDTNWQVGLRMTAPGRAIVDWQQADIRCYSATNTWEDLGRELENARSWLNGFQSLANHPVLDFHLDYRKALELQMPHLSSIRHAADLLQASAINNLRLGKPSESCADIRTMLRVVKGMAEERILQSQFVRMAIVRAGVEATWEVLQSPSASENDLFELQQEWESADIITPFESAQKMDRVMLIAELDQLRENPQEFWKMVMAGTAVESFAYRSRWRWLWSYADERRALEIDQIFLEAIRVAKKEQSYGSARISIESGFGRLGLSFPPPEKDGIRIDIEAPETRWLFSEGACDAFEGVRRCLTSETARNMAIAAIALHRFELRFHRLPARLEELTPDYVKSVPVDWMDGKFLRYRPIADGTFLLYSVGDNGRDDGGNPSNEKRDDDQIGYGDAWQSPHALDQVWPKPASDEEVKKYYAKSTKRKR